MCKAMIFNAVHCFLCKYVSLDAVKRFTQKEEIMPSIGIQR